MKEWLRNVARLYMPVYLYESDKRKIIYAGYSLDKKSYYTRLIVGNNYHHTFLGRYWFSKVPDLIKSLQPDMIVQ